MTSSEAPTIAEVPTLEESPGIPTAEAIIRATVNGPLASLLQDMLTKTYATYGNVDGMVSAEHRQHMLEMVRRDKAALDSVESILGVKKRKFKTGAEEEVYDGINDSETSNPVTVSVDALQNHPELLQDTGKDYFHVVTGDRKATNRTAIGEWSDAAPLPQPDYSIEGVDYYRHFKPETIELQWEGPADGNVQVNRNIQPQSEYFPCPGDVVSRKIDGEHAQIVEHNGNLYYKERVGQPIALSISSGGKFPPKARIDLEVLKNENYPEETKYVFLGLRSWGARNNIGYPLSCDFMRNKRILLNGHEIIAKAEWMPTDGLVIHRGPNDYVFKPRQTIDVAKPATKKVIDKHLGTTTDWRTGLWEYEVERSSTGIVLKPIKPRQDKRHENLLSNIIAMLDGPSFLDVYDSLASMVREGLIGLDPSDPYSDHPDFRDQTDENDCW